MRKADNDRYDLKHICPELVGRGNNARYLWVQRDGVTYEVEVVICRTTDHATGIETTYRPPSAEYGDPDATLH